MQTKITLNDLIDEPEYYSHLLEGYLDEYSTSNDPKELLGRMYALFERIDEACGKDYYHFLTEFSKNNDLHYQMIDDTVVLNLTIYEPSKVDFEKLNEVQHEKLLKEENEF